MLWNNSIEHASHWQYVSFALELFYRLFDFLLNFHDCLDSVDSTKLVYDGFPELPFFSSSAEVKCLLMSSNRSDFKIEMCTPVFWTELGK